MRAEFFVDTSAWYPLLVAAHPHHARFASALRAMVRDRRRLVTTNLVVAETHALLLRRVGRTTALTFVQTVDEAPNVIVRSTRELERTAEQNWLARYRDQEFSFTDAVSFAVMADRRIRDALTLDHHFAVAGFSVSPPGIE
ncbi:MAG TPA: PIN domain-containing protein [Gemmatimonadaceae bacterium]|nr:PIN domain-containing protein [Gemmatimonadaceae bacterium]